MKKTGVNVILLIVVVGVGLSCSQLEAISKFKGFVPSSKLLTAEQIKNINLESQIIVAGDLPDKYQFGKPTSTIPARYKDFPKALYQINIAITGGDGGDTTILLYDNDADIEKAFNPEGEPYDEKNALSGLGEKSSFLTISIPYGTGATTLDATSAFFVRCSAVVEIRIITKTKTEVSNYALLLDKRITPLVCNISGSANNTASSDTQAAIKTPIEIISDTQAPTITPSLEPPTVEPNLLFNADFNDPSFDGKYDTSQWKLNPSVAYTKIAQKDGVMVFSKTSTSGGENGKLTSVQTWNAAEFRHLEAKLKLDSRHTGSDGNMAIIFAPTDWWGWWEGCGITLDNQAPYAWCGQGFNDRVDFMNQNYPVSYDQWYTFAIDIDPATAIATFFLDGRKLNQWQPGNVSRLIKGQYNFSFGPVMTNGTTITGYGDNVRLSE